MKAEKGTKRCLSSSSSSVILCILICFKSCNTDVTDFVFASVKKYAYICKSVLIRALPNFHPCRLSMKGNSSRSCLPMPGILLLALPG